MQYEYEYDFEGRTTNMRTPSGVYQYSYYTDTGWKRADTLASWNQFKAQVSYTYDAMGLLSGWSMGRNPR